MPKIVIVDRVASAVELINNVVYKPEWTFNASAHTKRFEDGVKVDVTYAARNSDRDEAPGYETWIPGGARASFVIQVADCDTDDDVMRILLTEVILCVEAHEAREFLRYPGSLVAPFHPHRQHTMAAWGNPHADRAFGVA